ncbi:hypothetical protein V8E51_019408 [Hyaloscypha variabilis]
MNVPTSSKHALKAPTQASKISSEASKGKAHTEGGENATVAEEFGRPKIPKNVTPIELVENVAFRQQKNPEYRIVAYFQLQVKIHAFDKGYRKKNDKLFDFVSLRYLYHGCGKYSEKHRIKPHADELVGMKENDETTISKSIDLGLAEKAILMPAAAPSVGVHVGRDNKLAYERDSKSRRKGLSFESFVPLPTEESGWGVPGGKPTYVDARHLLHFDFVVTTRLRELGGKLKNPFSRHSSKPAEIRVKNDFGYPLKRDRVTFCLYSCPNAEAVIWPRTPTIDQQEIANALVAKNGPRVQKNLKYKDWKHSQAAKKAQEVDAKLRKEKADIISLGEMYSGQDLYHQENHAFHRSRSDIRSQSRSRSPPHPRHSRTEQHHDLGVEITSSKERHDGQRLRMLQEERYVSEHKEKEEHTSSPPRDYNLDFASMAMGPQHNVDQEIRDAQNRIMQKKKEDYLKYLKEQEAEMNQDSDASEETVRDSQMGGDTERGGGNIRMSDNGEEAQVREPIVLNLDLENRLGVRSQRVGERGRELHKPHSHHHHQHNHQVRTRSEPPFSENDRIGRHNSTPHYYAEEIQILRGKLRQVRYKHHTRSHSVDHRHTHALHSSHQHL